MAIIGQLTLNEILLLEVDADPSTSGIVAPIGSLAILDDKISGKLWVKSGAGNTAWSVVTRQSGTTALTSGGVIFADTSGFLSQDSMLFWDQTNKRLLVGSSTAQDITGLSVFPPFQILGTVATQMVVSQYSADIIPSVVNLMKSRGALNAQGLVVDGDDIGRLQFRASDGVNFQAAASVRAAVDGVAAAGSMPGRLLFLTTPSGSTTPLERLRIDNSGSVLIGTSVSTPSAILQVDSTTEGFLLPRMTSTQRNAISTPATGLKVYDTTVNKIYVYNGAKWQSLTPSDFLINLNAVNNNSNVTFTNLTDLTTNVVNGKWYKIDIRIIYQTAAATTGIVFSLTNATATGTFSFDVVSSIGADGTAAGFAGHINAFADVVSFTGVQTANVPFIANWTGIFRCTSTGTITPQFRSEVNGSQVTVSQGSYLEIEELN